jgi:hypothetical protein
MAAVTLYAHAFSGLGGYGGNRMATSLLAFNDVIMGGIIHPRRSPHQAQIRKNRCLRNALLRTACAPILLALLTGGVIWSRNAQAAREVSARPEVGAMFSPRALAPVTIAPRQIARMPVSFDHDGDLDQAAITWARRLPEQEAEPGKAVVTLAPDFNSAMMQFGPMRITRELVESVVRAARNTDTDPTLLMSIADKESAFAPTVKARTSSATGLFQFIDSTWLRVVRDFGAQHGLDREAAAIDSSDGPPSIADPAARRRILGLRNDPYLSAILAAEMLKHDAARIATRIGRELSDGETYLAHFLGPSDAEKFIAKLVSEPRYAAPKLLPKPARANRTIFFAAKRKAGGLSVADVHQKFETMMDLRAERYRDVEKLTNVSAYADTR